MLRLSEYYNTLFLARIMLMFEEKLKRITEELEAKVKQTADSVVAEAGRLSWAM